MFLKSLQQRLVVVFVGLLILVMTLIIVLVSRSSQRIVANETARELSVGTHVFERLIEQNRRQLETAATVLASDFAFREAIATQDSATVLSVIRNHGLRIGAQAMMVVSPEGQLMAHTQDAAPNPAASFPFPELLASARTAGKSSGFGQMRDGFLYQIVLVPIQAPRLIAWVAMGFLVDDKWARDLSDVIGLNVSIVRRPGDQAVLLASSLDPVNRDRLASALSTLSGQAPWIVPLGDQHYQTVQLPLDREVSVVLQRSLEQVQAPFNALQTALLLTLLGGVAIFSFGSVMLARRIVQPVRELTASARRIEAGDYARPVPSLPPDEIGQLATSFDHMRTQIANREEKILRLAYEDALTGLPNRTRFMEALSQQLTVGTAAIAVLNLDRFAMINNALGHTVGDRLLKEIGQRLARISPTPALVARLWGNEFAFLLGPNADAHAATAFAQAVLDTLRTPVLLENQRLDVGGSLGIALAPQDGQDAGTLLRRAEMALSAAKRQHLGHTFAADVGDEPAHGELSLIGEMREALTRGEFELYYQPKLDLASGIIRGAEALLRWRHPAHGLVPPARFLPFAEQTGFIREITPWVLEQVASQTAQWHRQGLGLVVSANLSTLDLLNPALIDHVQRLLAQQMFPPERLCLEITESALMDQPELALSHLHKLAGLGVKLSIDDYGSGQASLGYLKVLPVNELKIDRAFVTAVGDTPKNAAIVRSTILLSHELGLMVTAEGVETAADLAWLGRNGCDTAQGYGIARPVPAAELPGWISAFRVPA
jgi:diguanylate cyclase (GGDEF)-like protein